VGSSPGGPLGAIAMDRWLRPVRWLAWASLAGVAGLFVHAEAFRLGPPPGVCVFPDIVYRHAADGRRPRLDLYLPRRGAIPPPGRPAVVAIHGGGWRGGTKNTYGREVARLARRGYVVASVEYVLSEPGRPTWPENLDDVREAVRWVRRHAAEYGIDPARIAAMGSSAGGHLAELLGTQARGDEPEASVQAVVNLYGPSDLAGLFRSPGAVMPLRLYLGRDPKDAPGRYRDASPIAHASGRSAPTLIIHGDADMLVPVAQSRAMAERLKAAGIPAEVHVIHGAPHAFGLTVFDRDLVPEIAAFLESAWPRRG
jgi:acetyl esterase/lipase